MLKIQDTKKPIPKENEVLIRIHAASVTKADCLMRKADSFVSRLFLGLMKPKRKVLGTELSGDIEDVGKNVSRFHAGDKIYGFAGFKLGAYSEYTCMPEKGSLSLKPENLSYTESAVLVDGASTALFFLKEKSGIKSGDSVLIIGASGSIGTYAVQLAKYYGASVTGVCSTKNAEFVRNLGVDHVIDYEKQDFTLVNEAFDIIFDTATKSSFSKCKKLLKPGGKYLITKIKFRPLILSVLTKISGCKKVIFGMSVDKTRSLEIIKDLAQREVIKPFIDRVFPFENIIDAHKYAEIKQIAGSIAVSLISSDC